ncbi:MAG TPA: SigE family RNA polymerase sigma factor [Acidimicrobiales bacterium]|nr:SigE family RNA polymerase sigma factor [Acidimicrobiales bacterium]
MEDDEPAAFCRAIRDRLVGSLTLHCGDRAVAEELAQEALVRTWERWDQVGAMASPEAWTYRTAFNLASSWGRRRSAERRANRRHGPRPEAVAVVDTSTIEAVRSAVAALPPKQRSAVVCRFYLAMTVAETAETLGCAEGTVKSATHQALASLRAAGLVDDEPAPQEVETT